MDAELRFRAETVGASILPTYGLCLAGWLYAALTWDEPHRALLVAAFAIGVVSTFVLGRQRGRDRAATYAPEPFQPRA